MMSINVTGLDRKSGGAKWRDFCVDALSWKRLSTERRSRNALRTVNFDPVARMYRWLEYLSFGPWLARCRSAQLAHLAGARHALLLGDGDGRFLLQLLAVNSGLRADVVDSSRSMLTILKRRVRHFGGENIRLYLADGLEWEPIGHYGHYDLIVSHFFLDCFFPDQLEQLFDRVLPHAQPDAQWVVSEFAIPRNPLAAFLARGIIASLYRVFGLLTGLPVRSLPDYAESMRRRGLVLSHERRFLAGLLRSELWTLSSAPQK
jgi:ubiquinone/menaquinone biosynthesis C-methylase UbiE